MDRPLIDIAALAAAIVMVFIHLFSGRLRFLDGVPRSRWLSLAGGASVAYVFLHLLPDLSKGQETLAGAFEVKFLEQHVYLVALTGLATFYGLQRAAESSRHQQRKETGEDKTSAGVFWLHMASFAVYNLLIGYLLIHREQTGIFSLTLFAIAMGFHFLVTDYGLREQHKEPYGRYGRWILSAAVLSGWLIGILTEIGDVALAILVAFLAGGVILNILKEELPSERQSRFWAFAAGAVAYGVLLLAT
jgi:hypothetical protein